MNDRLLKRLILKEIHNVLNEFRVESEEEPEDTCPDCGSDDYRDGHCEECEYDEEAGIKPIKSSAISNSEIKAIKRILKGMEQEGYADKENYEQYESDLSSLEEITPTWPGEVEKKFLNHQELYRKVSRAIQKLEKLNKGQY